MITRNLFGELSTTAKSAKNHRFAVPEEKVSEQLSKYASNKPLFMSSTVKKTLKDKFIRTQRSDPQFSGGPRSSSESLKESNYNEMLKYSRNYAQMMEDIENGTFRDELLPQKREAPEGQEPALVKKEKLFAISQLKLQREEQKPKTLKHNRRVGMLNEPEIWCARCIKKHSADFHKKKPPTSKPMLLNTHRPISRAVEQDYYDEDEDDSDLSDFIAEDEEVHPNKVSQLVRGMFNYDPSKYRDIDRLDDRAMEATSEAILREEKHSAKIGALEDKAELMRQLARRRR